MQRRQGGLVVAGLIAACGPEDRADAEHERICGQPGPVQILALEDERRLRVVHQLEDWEVDDRRLLMVGYLGDVEDEYPFPWGDSYELWSVGPCGESPERIGPEFSFLRRDFHFEPPLACREETGEIFALDPSGSHEPNVVAYAPDCDFQSTSWGFITVEAADDTIGSVVLQAFPEDPWTQTATRQVLLQDVRIATKTAPHTVPSFHQVLAVMSDDIFAITAADELIRFSLLDGSTTIEATNAREFDVSPDLRWLVWQDLDVTNDDPEWPEGAIALRDLEAGTTTPLLDSALAYTSLPFQFIDRGVMRLQLGGLYSAPERILALPPASPSPSYVELPQARELWAMTDDGGWIVTGPGTDGPIEWFNRDLTRSRLLFDGDGALLVQDGRIEVLENVACCISQDYGRVSGRLWSLSPDREPELLARRAAQPYAHLPAGGIVTVLDVDEDWLGELVAVDPESLEELRVDDRVVSRARHVDDDGTILYAVSDEDRTGVWITRLASQ